MKIYDDKFEARILACADKLIFSKGLRGWNMDQLAAQAGLAKNTLYKIIGTKEKLVEKVVFNKIADVQLKLRQIIENEPDYFVALNKIIIAFPEVVSGFNETLGEIYSEYPALQEQVVLRRRETAAYIYNFLENGKQTGKLREDLDPEILILCLIAVLHRLLRNAKDSADFTTKLRVALSYFIHGISR